MRKRIKELPFIGTLRRAAMLAVAGAFLVSCSEELTPDTVTTGTVLRFSVVQPDGTDGQRAATTRSTLVATGDFHTSFGVFGYTYPGSEGWNDTRTPDYMYNVEYKKDDTGTYSSENIYYLPGKGMGRDVSFFAYAPYDAKGLVVPGQDADGAPTYEYTVPTDVEQQIDLCFTGRVEVKAGTEPATVELPFKHALTAVSFVEGNEMVEGLIVDIKLTNLYNKGKYRIREGLENGWELSDTKKDFSRSVMLHIPGKPGNPITDPKKPFILMPQTVNDDSSVLRVRYLKHGVERILTTPLNSVGGTAAFRFSGGEHFTFKINIVDDKLKIESVEATEWQPGQTSSVDVVSTRFYTAEKLKTGDYFYSDGTWSDGGLRRADLKKGEWVIADPKPQPVAGRKVVGIVYLTYDEHPDRFGEAELQKLREMGIGARGLVLSVKNAATDVMWAKERANETLDDLNTQADLYKDISGMANCDLIRKEYGSFDKFPAFEVAEEYNTTCPVPNTTGWYLPAIGQWWDILQCLSRVPSLASEYSQTDTTGKKDLPYAYTYRNEDGDDITTLTNSLDDLNAWMSKIPDKDKDDFPYPEYQYDGKNKHTSYYHWSSSEQGYVYAWSCDITRENDRKGWGYIRFSYYDPKDAPKYDVRPVLAF